MTKDTYYSQTDLELSQGGSLGFIFHCYQQLFNTEKSTFCNMNSSLTDGLENPVPSTNP